MTELGNKIKERLQFGHNYPSISRELNVAFSTIAYHAKKMNRESQSSNNKQFDWQAIQQFHNEGHNKGEIKEKFGISYTTINKAIKNNLFVYDTLKNRSRKIPQSKENVLKHYFTTNSMYFTSTIKKSIRRYDLIDYKCASEKCLLNDGINLWCDEIIILHLDHIDGIRNNNTLTNLRWLCPNCHSQTKTYCGRNKRL